MKIIHTDKKDDVLNIINEIKSIFREAASHFIFEKIWKKREIPELKDGFEDTPKINWDKK